MEQVYILLLNMLVKCIIFLLTCIFIVWLILGEFFLFCIHLENWTFIYQNNKILPIIHWSEQCKLNLLLFEQNVQYGHQTQLWMLIAMKCCRLLTPGRQVSLRQCSVWKFAANFINKITIPSIVFHNKKVQ